MRPDRALRAACLLTALAATACAVPVRAERVDSRESYAHIRANVLSGDEPSADAQLVLERADLRDAWESDPAEAIVRLHRAAAQVDTRARLFGLAELSLAEGFRSGDARWHLGAAVYAWLYLFGRADAPPPTAFDPRFRVACDIYARGLAEAFRDPESDAFVPRAGANPLPIGAIDVSVPSATLRVGDVAFDRFEAADDFAVLGMRSRVRSEGIGTPLVASRSRAEAADGGATDADGRTRLVPGSMTPRTRLAATALLRVDAELADLESGRARAKLEFVHATGAPTVLVAGRDVPVATDVTTPIAVGLPESKLWGFELSSFLSKDEAAFDNGIFLLAPYQRGKIPLVLVHGTASSPARWAEMVNELAADPVVASHYQVWLFIYATGSPILVSAQSLRKAIAETAAAVDPKGEDAALRRMVVAGHSQGGLLTRLLVTTSGDRFWHNVSEEPFESLDLTPDERTKLRSIIWFEPVPQVERVVFLATPHRGSFVAGGFFGKLGSDLISLPGNLVTGTTNIVRRNFARLTKDHVGALPTAVDNMQPGSTFVQALADCPLSPRVKVNSIVAVDGDGPPEEGDDGVVAYESAHLTDAESEIVVRSPHSCQGDPATILEVRRILREHAGKK
jgi:hypothetical protein